MSSRFPGNLWEFEFGPEFISSIESSDGEVHLRLIRLHFISVGRLISNSLRGDISKKNISIILSIIEVGDIGAAGMVVFNSVLPLE